MFVNAATQIDTTADQCMLINAATQIYTTTDQRMFVDAGITHSKINLWMQALTKNFKYLKYEDVDAQ